MEKGERTAMIAALWIITIMAVLNSLSYYLPDPQTMTLVKFWTSGLREGAYTLLFITTASALIYRCNPEK